MGALFSNLWQQGIWHHSEGRDVPFQGEGSQQDRFKSILPCTGWNNSLGSIFPVQDQLTSWMYRYDL